MYDMNHLSKLSTYKKLSPDAWAAYQKFDAAAMAEGSVSAKNKQLIAIAVAHTTQYPYCIEIYVNDARKAGATDEEIAESIFIASALCAGAAVAHGTHCF